MMTSEYQQSFWLIGYQKKVIYQYHHWYQETKGRDIYTLAFLAMSLIIPSELCHWNQYRSYIKNVERRYMSVWGKLFIRSFQKIQSLLVPSEINHFFSNICTVFHILNESSDKCNYIFYIVDHYVAISNYHRPSHYICIRLSIPYCIMIVFLCDSN